MGISSTGQQTTPSQHSAAPASGKYGGFGNKDLEQMGGNIGYSNPTASNKVNAYDPYVNGATTNNTKVTAVVVSVDKKKKKKKKKNESSDEDSSEDGSSSSSSEEESEEEKKKQAKKKIPLSTGLGLPGKADRTI